MAVKKPSVKKTVEDLKSLRVYLRSVKKFGKTTLFRDVILEEYDGDPTRGMLVGIGPEMGYNLLSGLNSTHITTWREMEELKDWLIKEKGKEHNIEIVGFDVIDELIPILEKEVCKLSSAETKKSCKSVNQAFGGYGKGQDKVKEIAKKYFFELYLAGFGLWGIAHSKVKNIVEKGMEDTEGYTVLTSNLSNSYEGIFGDIFDNVLTGMIDRETDNGKTTGVTRKLFLRGTHYVDAGCRFAMDSVPEYMLFDKKNNAPEFVRLMKQGMKLSAETTFKNVSVVENDIESNKPTPVKEVQSEIKETTIETPPVEQKQITPEPPDVIEVEDCNPEENKRMFAEIRPLYSSATTDEKTKVKKIITSYGFTKFDLNAPNSMFLDVLKSLQ